LRGNGARSNSRMKTRLCGGSPASAKEALERLGDDDEKRREAIIFYLEEFETLANSTHRETALGAAEAAFAIVTLGAPLDKEIILEVFRRWAQKGRAKRAEICANNAEAVKDIIRSIDPEQRMKLRELKKKLVAPLAKKGLEMPDDKTLYNYRKQIKSVDK
jgi:hypothetical protein